MFSSEHINSLLTNVKKKLGLEKELSPFVKWGGPLALFILYLFSIQNFTQYIDDTAINLAAINNQRAALVSIDEAPNVTKNIIKIAEQIEQIEQNYFREETVGLNNASFQTLLVEILNKCGLERLRVSTRTEADTENQNSGTIIAKIQAQDPKQKLMVCFSDLRVNTLNLEVISLDWRQRGNISFDVKAYYLPRVK